MTEASKYNHATQVVLPPMFWPAVCASVLPMTLGIIGLYFCFVPTDIGREFYHEYIFSIPIALCFTFGTPIVAWLSCRGLAERVKAKNHAPIKFISAAFQAVKNSFFVHLIAFLIHVTLISIFPDWAGPTLFFDALIIGGLINLVLYAIVTLPLSIFCAAIFSLFYAGRKDTPLL